MLHDYIGDEVKKIVVKKSRCRLSNLFTVKNTICKKNLNLCILYFEDFFQFVSGLCLNLPRRNKIVGKYGRSYRCTY